MLLLTFFVQTDFRRVSRSGENGFSPKVNEKCQKITFLEAKGLIAITIFWIAACIKSYFSTSKLGKNQVARGVDDIFRWNFAFVTSRFWKIKLTSGHLGRVLAAQNDWIVKLIKIPKFWEKILVRTIRKFEFFFVILKFQMQIVAFRTLVALQDHYQGVA